MAARLDTVAVIGHGTSPVGQGRGRAIDASDLVVRMWDCHWQDPADWGERYDIGVYTYEGNELRRLAQRCRRQPAERWWCYHLGADTTSRPELLERPVELVDPAVWRARAVAMGGLGLAGKLQLTRGTVAACRALALRPRQLWLVGFDEVRLGKLAGERYPAACAAEIAGQRPGVPLLPANDGRRTATHDYLVEGLLVRELAAAAGTALHWTVEGRRHVA